MIPHQSTFKMFVLLEVEITKISEYYDINFRTSHNNLKQQTIK